MVETFVQSEYLLVWYVSYWNLGCGFLPAGIFWETYIETTNYLRYINTDCVTVYSSVYCYTLSNKPLKGNKVLWNIKLVFYVSFTIG